MLIEKTEPFVRQASVVTLGTAQRYEVYHELRAADCRLFYITDGSGCITVEKAKHRLHSGSVILIPGGTRYMWQPDQNSKLVFISVNFDFTKEHSHIKKSFHPVHSKDFLEADILESPDFDGSPDFPLVTDNPAILQLLHTIITEFCAGGELRDALLSSLMRAAIIMLIRQNGTVSDNKKDGSNIVRALIQYIENNYRDNITNETIAEAFHYSSAYINRVFKRHTGMTLHAYLINCRIKAAMKLLGSRDLTVEEVSSAVGFSDAVHFTKTFKKHTGRTPAEFRRD